MKPGKVTQAAAPELLCSCEGQQSSTNCPQELPKICRFSLLFLFSLRRSQNWVRAAVEPEEEIGLEVEFQRKMAWSRKDVMQTLRTRGFLRQKFYLKMLLKLSEFPLI
uniref:Uncharacterized protein n=2 Tax=Manihot esculenta TaxID=3983 RepID=A0A2C9UBL6_MANES